MANHPHQAESAVIDMQLFRRRLASGKPVSLEDFDAFADTLTRLVRLVRATEVYARCGDTPHSRRVLRDAGLTAAPDDTVIDIRHATKRRRDRCNDPDAA